MGTAGKGNAGMKTNIMTGICVFVILCLLAALLIVLAAGRAREKKLLRRLQALEKELDEKEQREIRMHQATRVQFETLDTNY